MSENNDTRVSHSRMDDDPVVLLLDQRMCATLDRILYWESHRHDGDHHPKAQEKLRETRSLWNALDKARREWWDAL